MVGANRTRRGESHSPKHNDGYGPMQFAPTLAPTIIKKIIKMNQYNPKIHHRRSIRLKGYDYAQTGLYFITICCQDRKHLFGEIVEANVGANVGPNIGANVGANCIRPNAKMILNKFGQIAHDEWLNTIAVRGNVELGEFIIMPNHIHGIIKIMDRGESHSPNDTSDGTSRKGELHSFNDTDADELHSPIIWDGKPSGTGDGTGDGTGECNSPLRGTSQTIGAIVRGYKSAVTKQLNLLNIGCVVWQRNYYENIIRDEQAYTNISNYIVNNPSKWAADKFYTT